MATGCSPLSLARSKGQGGQLHRLQAVDSSALALCQVHCPEESAWLRPADSYQSAMLDGPVGYHFEVDRPEPAILGHGATGGRSTVRYVEVSRAESRLAKHAIVEGRRAEISAFRRTARVLQQLDAYILLIFTQVTLGAELLQQLVQCVVRFVGVHRDTQRI